MAENENSNALLIGATVGVLCSYDNPEKVNPPPSMNIAMVNGSDNLNYGNITRKQLLAKGGIGNLNSTHNSFIGFNQLKATKTLAREDMNKRFVCETLQRFDEEDIFSENVTSDPLIIFQKPTIVEEYILPDYYMLNNTNVSTTIIMPLKFSSNPKPENKHVTWTITEYNSDPMEGSGFEESDGYDTYIIHPATSISRYTTHPLRFIKDDIYEATIEAINVTHNVTIVLEISNLHGEFQELLPEIIVPFEPKITKVVMARGPMLWVIVLVAAILVISIMMFSFMVCIQRKNKKHQEELDEIDNNDNLQVEKSVYKKEKIITDKNDLSFHISELGESKKFHRASKKFDFNASLQDLRSETPKGRFSWKQPRLQDPTINVRNKPSEDIRVKEPRKLKPAKQQIQKCEIENVKVTSLSSPKKESRTKLEPNDTHESDADDEKNNATKPEILETEISSRKVTFLEDESPHSLVHEDLNLFETKPVLRHSGPTNYPVLAPPDEDDSFKKTPSRVTSPIHFTGPTEAIVPITIMSRLT